MSTSPSRAAHPGSPAPRTYLVVHGNWYAVQPAAGVLISGPILVTGQPDFTSFGEVDFKAARDKGAETALREIARTLAWLNVAGVETALVP